MREMDTPAPWLLVESRIAGASGRLTKLLVLSCALQY
jgi:hypothetical protein